jgi:hypothetical protein
MTTKGTEGPVQAMSMEEKLARLKKLDLTKVGRKLMEPEPEGRGWTRQQVEVADKWYRRFWEIIIRFPESPHVPNIPIDLFWHQHILDTRAYRSDCASILGRFLDHHPYFGMNGDAVQRDAGFVETNVLYRKVFGEDCTVIAPSFERKPAACSGGCNSGCSSRCIESGSCASCRE